MSNLLSESVKLVPVLAKQVPGRLGQRGALVEGQLAKRGTANPAPVVESGGEVNAVRGDPRDLFPGHRVVDRPAVVRGLPPAAYVASEHRHWYLAV
jgi:hypothetical protein